MALSDGKITVDGDLILSPTDYSSGGTDLGLLETMHLVGFNHDVELLTKQNYGTHYVNARILGTNVVYEITVGNRSTTLMSLLSHSRADADDWGENQPYLYGNLVGSDETNDFLIRPNGGTTQPYLYIPKGFILDIGPVVFDRRTSHHDLTTITIIALWDTDNDTNVFYGDPTTWSVLQP